MTLQVWYFPCNGYFSFLSITKNSAGGGWKMELYFFIVHDTNSVDSVCCSAIFVLFFFRLLMLSFSITKMCICGICQVYAWYTCTCALAIYVRAWYISISSKQWSILNPGKSESIKGEGGDEKRFKGVRKLSEHWLNGEVGRFAIPKSKQQAF